MKEHPMTPEVARKFLLGAVDDSERQHIESLFMTDPETKETILSAEEELLEDYLEGSLSDSDSAKFLQQYAHGPRQQRKLRIKASIRAYALSEAQLDQRGTSAVRKVGGFTPLSWLRGRRFIPIAATLIVVVIAAVWLIQWNNRPTREASSRLALERELTVLNSPSGLNQNQSPTLSVVLPPISLRSINPSEMMSRSHQVIELQLVLTQYASESYTAVLRRVGETYEFTIANLRAEKTSAAAVVKVRIPAKSLPPGHYEIDLIGISKERTDQYDFVIVD